MLTHRGFSAWIVANGQVLKEHLVAVDEGRNQVSCWIPSEVNQAFAVYWKDHDGKVDTCSYIELDGATVPGRFLYGTGSAYRSGVRTSANTEKPFTFQHHSGNATSANKDVGMITLKIKRVRRKSTRPPEPLLQIPQGQPSGPTGDLRVGYGKKVASSERFQYTWEIEPYDDPPGCKTPSTYVSFVFRYRAKDFLISQGIMPPTPKATSTASRQSATSMRRVASAPVVPALQLPSALLPTPTVSPSYPSPPAIHCPRPQRPVIIPQHPLLPLSHDLSCTRHDLRRPTLIGTTRRAASMKELPYRRNGLPGQGIIKLAEYESDYDYELDDDTRRGYPKSAV